MTTDRMVRLMGRASQLRTALLEVLVPWLLGMWLDRYFSTSPWMSLIGVVLGFVIAGQHFMTVANVHRQHEISGPGSTQRVRLRTAGENASGQKVEEESIY